MSLEFRSPEYEQASISIPKEVTQMDKPFNGTVCSNKGDEYVIKNNIIDFLGEDPLSMTWAQSSNHWKITAAIYEDIWRKRSLSILTGEDFPIQKEQELLIEWLNPQPDHHYLDIGCSTALYARLIKKAQPDCTVIALDFSKQMLEEARLKAQADETDLYLLRADARKLPFYGATFDGLMMGGTLNELTDPIKVMYEARRVVKKEGVFFMMHLIKADAWYARLLQDSAGLGGITFWTLEESNQLFERAGFTVAEQFTKGIVCFTKLIPA
ncbi:methyltransferase domain-containing protein [Balneolaceae bacterium YR4-1]|uniref:Methyltransferase domain-containing protein n=1 Tax=Halalkalibaculum roseum TaxID=2709311 RepID=A0A6M1SZ80_9BACT|nr:methyltransferase domain-containing protein [Halalkalibaculum roseum]NGP75175.1 methyltransferase domain-containing protein [Halalkalibaculum roseum]